MIARRALVSILNNVAGAFLGLIGLNFVTAYAGKSAWGMWVYGGALTGLLALGMGLGFPSAHVKRVSQGVDEARANATFLWIKLGLTAVFGLLAFGAVFAWTRLLDRPLTDTTEAVLVMALLYHVLVSLRQYFDMTFQAHRLVALYESVLLVDTLTTVGGVVTVSAVIARLDGRSPPFSGWADVVASRLGLAGPTDLATAAYLVALAYLLGKLVSFVYSAAQFLRLRRPFGRPDRAMARSYLAFAAPVAIVGVLAAFTTTIDRAFLGFFGGPGSVAEYNLAVVLLNPMLIASAAIGLLLFPVLSQMHQRSQPHEILGLLAQADRYLSMLLVPQFMLAFVFGQEAIRFITGSTQFDGSVPILRILALFVFLHSALTPTRSLLLGFDRPRFLARLGFINAILVAGLNVVAIPDDLFGVPLLNLGGVGAALVAALSALVSYLYLRHHARGIAPTPWLPPEFGRQVLAGALSGLALWVLRIRLPQGTFENLGALVAAALVGLALYVGSLALLRGLRKADVAFFLDLAHLGKFARYVGQEVGGRRRAP